MLLKTIIYAQTDTVPMCEKHDTNQAPAIKLSVCYWTYSSLTFIRYF